MLYSFTCLCSSRYQFVNVSRALWTFDGMDDQGQGLCRLVSFLLASFDAFVTVATALINHTERCRTPTSRSSDSCSATVYMCVVSQVSLHFFSLLFTFARRVSLMVWIVRGHPQYHCRYRPPRSCQCANQCVDRALLTDWIFHVSS